MKELGFTTIEVKNLGVMSREDAIKKTLSFEELKIPLDTIETAKLVKALQDAGDSLKGLPYFDDEIKNKIDMLNFDYSQYGDKGDLGEVEKKKITCPECGAEITL